MGTSFRFPIADLLSEERSYEWLVEHLHPEGLHCPAGHERPDDEAPHTRNRAPVVEYRCRVCGRVYNVFTDTVLNGIRYPCSKVVLILRGFFQGATTKGLAEELGIDRMNLLRLRHDVQAILHDRFPPLGSARQGHRSGRDVPERGGEGRSASRSGRSAKATGKQATGPRNVRQRPPARGQRGRS